MTRHQQKFHGPHTIKKRKTFKKHSEKYKKVYHPYLPAVLILILSLAIFGFTSKPSNKVLSYATDISQTRMLEETNSKRIENKTGTLKHSKLLAAAAQNKAEDMTKRDYWSHSTPDGKQPWQFITEAGYRYSVASENLAYGFSSPSDAINGWMKSSAHKQAMLDPLASEVGFGFSNSPNYQGSGPQTVIVAVYASPSIAASLAQVKNLSNDTPQKISFAQSISGLNGNTTNFIVGLLIGGLAVFIAAKNIVVIRRKIKKSQKFILHHPAFDATAVSVIVLLVVISRTAGFIQ